MPLKIEKVSSDRYFDFLTIEGMTVDEINYIISGNGNEEYRYKAEEYRLAEVMEKYGKRSTAEAWMWGYGIYSIRHIGGHLLIEVGNNCD